MSIDINILLNNSELLSRVQEIRDAAREELMQKEDKKVADSELDKVYEELLEEEPLLQEEEKSAKFPVSERADEPAARLPKRYPEQDAIAFFASRLERAGPSNSEQGKLVVSAPFGEPIEVSLDPEVPTQAERIDTSTVEPPYPTQAEIEAVYDPTTGARFVHTVTRTTRSWYRDQFSSTRWILLPTGGSSGLAVFHEIRTTVGGGYTATNVQVFETVWFSTFYSYRIELIIPISSFFEEDYEESTTTTEHFYRGFSFNHESIKEVNVPGPMRWAIENATQNSYSFLTRANFTSYGFEGGRGVSRDGQELTAIGGVGPSMYAVLQDYRNGNFLEEAVLAENSNPDAALSYLESRNVSIPRRRLGFTYDPADRTVRLYSSDEMASGQFSTWQKLSPLADYFDGRQLLPSWPPTPSPTVEQVCDGGHPEYCIGQALALGFREGDLTESVPRPPLSY